MDAEELIDLVEGDDHEEDFDLEPAFRVSHRCGRRAHSPVQPSLPHFVVGNFSFQKMAMVRDLRELLEALVQHDIVAAMARDPGASAALRTAPAQRRSCPTSTP